MKIEITGTEEELKKIGNALMDEAGISCDNPKGMGIILSEVISEALDVPFVSINIINLNEKRKFDLVSKMRNED